MAKVSVIIPTYNVETYLRQCMDSILSQTLTDIEILAVNDGSTDRSLEILQEYAAKDSRVRVLDGPNGGYGKAMNRGLDAATGEYIGIVEPDDFIPAEMYQELYDIAVKDDLDFVKADFYRFTENRDGSLNKIYVALSPTGIDYGQVLCPYDHLEVFKFVLNTWSGIYKRSFIEEFHIRHNETPGASYQDNGFWFQTFARARKVMFVHKPYYMNRRDNPNSSVRSRGKVYCMNEEYAHIYRFLEHHPDIKNHLMGVYNYKRYHNYVFTFNRIADEFRKEYAQRFSDEFRIAYQKNEIDESLFKQKDLDNISVLLEDPLKYYYRQQFIKEIEAKYGKIERLKKDIIYMEKLRKTLIFRIIRKLKRKK